MSKNGDGIETNPDIELLEETILLLEAQRDLLDDKYIDTALAPLREKLANLQERQDSIVQQRKFVTILFADMVGWTELSQRLELEDMMDLTDRAIRRFNRIIERRGGRVLKFMGDGLMAVFGIPQLQEDDAERAIQAGLDILGSAEIYAQVLEERWNLLGFNVRVGANTGPIIMGGGLEEERSAVGMTVNLASRMESTAPSGTFRITHATYQQVRGLFEVEPQPLLQVKGKDQPLLTYLVKATRPRSFRMGRHGIKGIKTPLIGRQAEFEQLISLFNRSVQDREAHIVTIVGEPGIGKSRLMSEFETWLHQQPTLVHTFQGRGFQSFQDSPYSLLRSLIAHYCLIQDNDALEIVHSKLETQLAPFFEEDALMKIHFIGALLGYNFDESPYLKTAIEVPQELNARALHYLAKMFAGATDDGMTTILVEDIHWADDSTLQVLQKLALSCVDKPLFIVCITRPDLYDHDKKWPEPSRSNELNTFRLDLAPLSEKACKELIEAILKKAGDVPEALIETILQQADGNPYYIEELIKMLMDDGVINRLGGGADWQINISKFNNIRVPDTITAVMLARLQNLASEERLYLQRASVAGRSFWSTMVNAISGEMVKQQAILAALMRNDLIYRNRESTFAREDEFVFKHGLLREAVYETILIGDRQTYHGRVADWLKGTSKRVDRVGEFARVIANHYDLAGMPDLAADYYLRAAEKARDQGVPVEALRSMNRALEIMTGERSTREWNAMLVKEVLLGWLGKFEDQLAFNQALVEYADQEGDEDHLAEAYYRLGFAARSLGRYEDEAKAYKTALVTARSTGNLAIEAKATALLAHCLLRLGRLDRAKPVAQDAIKLVDEVQDDLVRARALTNVACYYSEAGEVAKAINLFSEVVEVCARNDIKFGETVNRNNLGYNYVLMGLPELASETLQEASRLTQAIGARQIRAFSQMNLGLSYLRQGYHDQAQATFEETLVELESFGDQFGQGTVTLYLGLSLEQSGALAESSIRFKRAHELFKETGTPSSATDAVAGMARCSLARGDLGEARRGADQVWAYLVDNGSEAMPFPGLAYLTCSKIYEAVGEDELSRLAANAGYADLMKKAEKITVDAWRQSFLLNIPEHQALIERQRALVDSNTVGPNAYLPPGG